MSVFDIRNKKSEKLKESRIFNNQLMTNRNQNTYPFPT